MSFFKHNKAHFCHCRSFKEGWAISCYASDGRWWHRIAAFLSILSKPTISSWRLGNVAAFYSLKMKHIFTWSVQITDTAIDLLEPVSVFMAYWLCPWETESDEKYCHEHGECKSIAEMAKNTKIVKCNECQQRKAQKSNIWWIVLDTVNVVVKRRSIIIGSVSKAFTVAFHDGNRKLTLLDDFPKTYPRSTLCGKNGLQACGCKFI